MDKEKRINYLLKICESAVERWDELSQVEQNDFSKKILEASRLSHERTNEVIKESEKLRLDMADRLEEMSTAVAIYEAFLAEKKLIDEFKSFVEEMREELHGGHRPNLTLIQ